MSHMCKFYGYVFDYIEGDFRYVESEEKLEHLFVKDYGIRISCITWTITRQHNGKEIVMAYQGDYAFQFPTPKQIKNFTNNFYGKV